MRHAWLRIPTLSLLWIGLTTGSPAATDSVDRDLLLEQIREWQTVPERLPLEAVVEALSGHRMLRWEGEGLDDLHLVSKVIISGAEKSPLSAPRTNEIGNHLETLVSAAMTGAGWQVNRPAGPSGRRRSVGYPDLEASAHGRDFYIEIKAFSPGTRDSTQRSFYLSPSADFKVTRDACHLLLACGIISVGEGAYGIRSVRWLDLSGLEVRLTHEFNASNRDLYGQDGGLVILETGAGTIPVSGQVENKP